MLHTCHGVSKCVPFPPSHHESCESCESSPPPRNPFNSRRKSLNNLQLHPAADPKINTKTLSLMCLIYFSLFFNPHIIPQFPVLSSGHLPLLHIFPILVKLKEISISYIWFNPTCCYTCGSLQFSPHLQTAVSVVSVLNHNDDGYLTLKGYFI